ncbi:MAG TPA: hypothetical protein PKH10_03985 [bacterium]|nr:hypothetical protein [bacterium]
MSRLIFAAALIFFFGIPVILSADNNKNDNDRCLVSKTKSIGDLENIRSYCDELSKIRANITLGEKYSEEDNLERNKKAISYFLKAIDIIEKSSQKDEYKTWEFISFKYMSYVYSNKKFSLDKFLEITKKAYGLSQEIGINDNPITYNMVVANYRKALALKYMGKTEGDYGKYLRESILYSGLLVKSESNMHKTYTLDILARIANEFDQDCDKATEYYNTISRDLLSLPQYQYVITNMINGYMSCAEKANKTLAKDNNRDEMLEKETCKKIKEWYMAALNISNDKKLKGKIADRLKNVCKKCSCK